jgi:hypothetical protein
MANGLSVSVKGIISSKSSLLIISIIIETALIV